MPGNSTARTLRFLMFLAAALLLVVALDCCGIFEGVDTYFYDTFLRLRGTRTVSPQIVIVAVDTKTLEHYGQWPIKRRYYAAMLNRLAKADMVAFDLILREPTADDQQLGAAIKRHGKVLLPAYVDRTGKIVGPLGDFAPYGIGHIHIELGVDNTARELFHSMYCGTAFLPSLTSRMYETVSGKTLARHAVAEVPAARLQQQERHRINYYGPPGTFPRVSLADLLDGTVSPDFFTHKLVLVGLTAPGIPDDLATPVSQTRNRMSGVEVHANILNNLLDNNAIQEISPAWRLVAILCSGFLLAFILARQSEKAVVLAWLLSLMLMLSLSCVLLAATHQWVAPAAYLTTFTVVAAAMHLNRLDNAARRLDQEYEVMSALLGRDSAESLQTGKDRGLLGFLSESGINAKIGRQLAMTDNLLELHKQLERALKTEREALDSQIRFVEMLSHEYRTPLAIIRANLDILEMKDSSLGGGLSGNFSKMRRAMARLIEVMDSSLGRERLEESRALKASNEEIELGGLLASLLRESGELWSERVFQCHNNGCENCYLFADRLLVKTALLNLIDNAVKYSAVHEPVQVVLERNAASVIITVINHGVTIDPQEIGRVFDKFYRGGSSVNTRGAGLGLYLVRKIIEQVGGQVALTSDPVQGETTAVVTLPLCR